MYFTDAGNLTDNPQEGRIVYQYLRKITNQNGKLYVGNPQNTQNRKYTLVDPEVLAQRHADKIEENGGKVSNEIFKAQSFKVLQCQNNWLLCCTKKHNA